MVLDSAKTLHPEEGLFSRAVKAGDLLFLAQAARAAGNILRQPGGVKDEVREIVDHLGSTLKSADLHLKHLVSLNVFLTEYQDAPAAAEVLDAFFPAPEVAYPATTFVGVMGLGGRCRVAIDAVASANPDREQICVPEVPYSVGSRCHGVRIGNLFFLSGIDAADQNGTLPSPPNIEHQTLDVLNKMETILRARQLKLSDLCRTFMFSPSTEYRPGYTETRKRRYHGIFQEHEFPPNSGIYVNDLGVDILLRSIAIAFRGSKAAIHSPKVREAPGLFSQAVRVGNWIFVAGQDAVGFYRDVEAVGDLAGQTEAALRHVKDIVEEAGGAMSDVVKTTVYLLAGQDRSIFAETYQKFFEAHCSGSILPAGLTVEVRELSPSCLVEIDALALLRR